MNPKLRFLSFFRSKGGALGRIKSYTERTHPFQETIKVRAFLKGMLVGNMDTTISFGSKRAFVKDTGVDASFRKMGISAKMFKETMVQAQKKGASTLVGQEVLSPFQVLIRAKHKTKFIGYGMGKYQEEAGLISKARALDMLNNKYVAKPKYIGSVMAVTKIPKDAGQTKVTFKRIRGRIIPIRNKK